MWKYIERFLKADRPRATGREQTGLWGEQAAESLLRAKGYKILSRRLRIGPRDEIDLVARSGDALVFVEIKTRANEEFGRPFAAVDRGKRFHLARAAVRYLKRLKNQPASFRFDVVEVVGRPDGAEPVMRHIESAFPLPKNFRVP